jgi:hypothetical protein
LTSSVFITIVSSSRLAHSGRVTAKLSAHAHNSLVFCCPNYEDLHAGIVGRYIYIEQSFLIPLWVDHNPDEIQRFARSNAHLWRLFTHCNREHDNIQSFQKQPSFVAVRTLSKVKVESKLRSLVSWMHARKNVTHVGGQTRNAEQARFLVQHVVDLFGIESMLSHEEDQDSGVYWTRARTHHESL